MDARVPLDVIVPVKPLRAAKSRLRGAVHDPAAHPRLALALLHDTVAAVRAARRIRRLLVVSSDPVVAAELAAVGVEVVPDRGAAGLNPAYEHAAGLLRGDDPRCALGALPADLPALRPAELEAAVTAFHTGGSRRAFVADADGTGTTFLLAGPGVPLRPRFGAGSAAAHRASGARELRGSWAGLRRDVDTAEDLRRAAELGLGPHTRDVLTDDAGKIHSDVG